MNARDLSTGRLMTGLAFVMAGALLTVQAAGLLHVIDLSRSWPLFIVVLAFVQLAATIKERHQQGWGSLLAGDWLLFNTTTGWSYVQISVPVLLGGIGLLTIVRAVREHNTGSDENQYATQ